MMLMGPANDGGGAKLGQSVGAKGLTTKVEKFQGMALCSSLRYD
jgi:hypothetical protein